jgi:large repetitive protein
VQNSILGTVLDGVLDTVLGILGLGGQTSNSTGPPSELPDGTYNITGDVMDVAGTYSSQSSPMTVAVATLNPPPTIAGVSLATSQVGLLSLLGLGQTQQSLSVVGTAPPNDGVQVYLGGNLLGTATANAQGNWSYNYVPSSPTVADGTYGFSAVSAGSSGNISIPSPLFQLQVGGDTTAGTPEYSDGTLSGVATAGSLVTIVVDDVVLGVVVANASGVWQFTPDLSNGKYNVMVEATNGTGETSLLSSALSINV